MKFSKIERTERSTAQKMCGEGRTAAFRYGPHRRRPHKVPAATIERVDLPKPTWDNVEAVEHLPNEAGAKEHRGDRMSCSTCLVARKPMPPKFKCQKTQPKGTDPNVSMDAAVVQLGGAGANVASRVIHYREYCCNLGLSVLRY